MTVTLVISIVFLIALMLIGVPLALSFFASACLLCVLAGYGSNIFLITYAFVRLRAILLLAIPLFIMAGGLMGEVGIAERLINFAELIVGRFKATMGVVTNISCAIFGAVSGSSAAAAACMGSILVPRLIERGHDKAYTASLVAAAAVLGILIPPSIPMIVYGWSSDTSVAACFLAGVGPGLLLVTTLSIVHIVMVRHQPVRITPQLSGKESKKRTIYITRRSIGALGMPIVILGGIYGGVFTPTEAAAVAVVYALLIGFVFYRTLNLKNFRDTIMLTATTAGAVMFVLFGIQMVCRLYMTEDLPERLAILLLGISQNKYVLLALINVMLLIIGMFMDTCSAILAVTPLMIPIVQYLGVDPIHFAAIICANLGAGYMTPPVAGSLFITQRIAGVNLGEMFRPSLIMLVFGFLPVLVIVTYIPQVSLFLPHLLGY